MIKDSELLNLMEHYKWNVLFASDGTIIVVSAEAKFKVEGATLRLALDNALTAQRQWCLS